ncbi:hypothetical protein [Treponema sp. R8-4-B8]
MEFVRKVVDSSVLDHVLSLPHSFHNHKVEIIVFPVQDRKTQLNDLMEGSITQSLIGAIPHSDITLDEIRALRLKKYDSIT